MDWRFSTFLVALLAILFGFTWAASEPKLCGSEYIQAVLADHTKDGAFNCFDFWLNRYQTLLTGFIALAAAAIAWAVARGQMTLMKAQNRIALGDIPTIFYCEAMGEPSARLTKARLHVINENRRALKITAIEFIEPTDLLFFIYDRVGGRLRQLSSYPYARRYGFELRIDGTRPSAAEVSVGSLELWVTWLPTSIRMPSANDSPVSLNCVFRIDYEYIGGDIRHERTTVEVPIQLRG